jgi:ribosomal protein S18 acetylase RimI-like enzyme
MSARVRLEPMDEEQFRDSLERSIVRHGTSMVRRGYWAGAVARATARAEFALMLPKGRRTANHRFRTIVDADSGGRVGETWCTVRVHGGKLQYWVDWLWIDEPHRRAGFGRAALRALAMEAAAEGADRLGLSVLADNLPAQTLYESLGFRDESRRMVLRLAGRDPTDRSRARRRLATRRGGGAIRPRSSRPRIR